MYTNRASFVDARKFIRDGYSTSAISFVYRIKSENRLTLVVKKYEK